MPRAALRPERSHARTPTHPPRGPAKAPAPARTTSAVGYLRRSTDRQEQSIPDQQKAVERFAAERGFTIQRFYVDDAISGTSTLGRRAFQALIEDAKQPGCPFGLVICYDVKRFGRVDNDEAGYYRHILKSHGVEVLYASENFTGDGTDDLLRPVKQWQARQESKDLAKVTIRGLLSKAASVGSPSPPTSDGAAAERACGGWWMGGAPPYGYDLRYESQSGQGLFTLRYLTNGSKQMLDDGGALVRTLGRDETVAVSKRDRCKLVPGEPVRVDVVRTIFRLYVEERRGFKAITDRLNRLGPTKAPTARGPDWSRRCSGQWATGTIRAILMNPAYKGDMAWNRRTDGRFFRIANGVAVERRGVQGRRLAPNEEADWIVTENAHAPLVTRRVWDKARRLRESLATSASQTGVPKDTTKGWKGPRAKFLLSGLCSCGGCASRYEGVKQPSTRSDAGSFAYACGGYIRRGRSVCTRGTIPKAALESAVTTAVTGYYSRYAGDEGRRALLEEFERVFGVEREGAIKAKAGLTIELERLDRTVRNLLDNITKANKEAVDKRLAEIETERETLERDLRALEHAALSRKEVGALVGETAAFIAALPGLLAEGSMEERQAALRRCVQRITVERGRPALAVELRTIPTVVGGPDAGATTVVNASLPGAPAERRSTKASKRRKTTAPATH